MRSGAAAYDWAWDVEMVLWHALPMHAIPPSFVAPLLFPHTPTYHTTLASFARPRQAAAPVFLTPLLISGTAGIAHAVLPTTTGSRCRRRAISLAAPFSGAPAYNISTFSVYTGIRGVRRSCRAGLFARRHWKSSAFTNGAPGRPLWAPPCWRRTAAALSDMLPPVA